MSGPRKDAQNDSVAEKVLRRAEVNKMARKLQNRLALAHFKTKHGWEDLSLDVIEPKYEAEILRKRPGSTGDMLSDSSSNSEFHYPASVRNTPIQGAFYSDAVGSGSSTGPRKRNYSATEFKHPESSNGGRKRYRSSPTHSHGEPELPWKSHHGLPQSSPIRPRKQQSFAASSARLSFFPESEDTLFDQPSSPNFAAASDDEENMLPMHSFQFPAPSHGRTGYPPRTPPPLRARAMLGKSFNGAKEEGADLLLYLATSPSPARPRMHPPSTPPSRTMALPSSMMTTPGGVSGFFPNTPGQHFDFSEFVNVTPSPAQGGVPSRTLWAAERTPNVASTPGTTTTRRRLDFGSMPSPAEKKDDGPGMQLGAAL